MEKYPIQSERLFLRSPSINVCFRVVIEGTFERNIIEETIEQMHLRHPLLGCSVETDDDNNAWFIPKNNPVTVEHYKSGEMDWQVWYKKNDSLPFYFSNGTLVRFCIITGETTEMIILGHHIIGDGIGYLNLVKDILLALDNRTDMTPFMPPFEAKDKCFKETIPLNIIEKVYAKALNKKWRKSRVRFSEEYYLAFFRQYHNKYKPEYYMAAIENENLQKILDNSKSNGLSVNEIIASAFSLACMETFNRTKIRLAVAANTRNELVSQPNNCMGNFVTGISVNITCNRPDDFMSNAKAIAAVLRNQLAGSKNRHLAVHFLNEFDEDLLESIMFVIHGDFEHPVSKKLAALIGEQTQNKGLGISNLGRHDFYGYDNFKVTDMQFIGPAFPANAATVGIITVNEKMNICVRFNGGEIKGEIIKVICEKAINLLSKDGSA